MGFFSDLKEDLSQAVNELMPEDEKSKVSEPEGESGVSLDEMLKNIDDFRLPEELEAAQPEAPEETAGSDMAAAAAEPEQAQQKEYGFESENAEMEELLAQMLAESPGTGQEEAAQDEVIPEEAISEEAVPDGIMPDEAAQDAVMPYEAAADEVIEDRTIMEESEGEEEEMDMEGMELVRDLEATDETSVITQGMTITGDMSTQGSIDVIGTVNGNIDALGKLNITGHVNGNSKAAEIYAESAKINGEIVSEGAVKIGASSVIIGNITATSAAIAGAVKGDIDVKGPVILDASAIVMGNIKSKSVQINNGAVIEGMCSQCYADVSPTTFFDEYKPEGIRKTKAKQGEQRENKS